MQLLSAILCVILAIIGFKSLHLFAISNGLAGHLERQISNISTPAGKKLSTLTTGGRFPKVDLQINAVASFLLLFCENLTQPDVNIVGFSFAASWGSSWLLIVLESFREYSQSRMMSWVAIPGILIFNQSHAVFTSLYLAIRLVIATQATTAASLMVDTIHLRAILWSFSLGYILPMSVMAMPGLSALGLNTKHVIASMYQQWNLYISLFHFILVSWWTRTSTMDRTKDEGPEHLLSTLRPVYAFAFILAVTSVWIPILLSFLAYILKKIRRLPAFSYESFQFANLFLPPSPWSRIKCKNALEGGKWLLQWDGMIGGLSTAIWAISLYTEARNVIKPQEVMEPFCTRLIGYMLLGGPIGVATGVLWERDNLVLQQL